MVDLSKWSGHQEGMPSHVETHINMMKYASFDPYILRLGTVDDHRKRAEEIVEWWPGWITHCLAICQVAIEGYRAGEYVRGVPFPLEEWQVMHDVFQKARG